MYCTKCGNKLLDEALFCTNCGAKIQRTAVTQTMTEREVQTAIPVGNEMPKEVPAERPDMEVANQNQSIVVAQKEEVVPVNISIQQMPAGMDNAIGQNQRMQVNYNMAGNIEGMPAIKEKNTIKPLAILSIIFSVFAIVSAVIEMIDVTSDMKDISRLLIISMASIMVILYAVMNNKTVSCVKGNALIFVFIADVIFVGFRSIKYAVENLDNVSRIARSFDVSEGLISTYLVTIIVWFMSMYIFLITDSIRAIVGTVKVKIITLFFGYIAVLAVIMQMIFKLIIEDEIVLLCGFLPVNITYVIFLLAVMFGISSKKNCNN